jgi:hypothetical protein
MKDGPSCLCGHFEWCKHCRTQPPTKEELARIAAMKPEGWAESVPVPTPMIPSCMIEAAQVMGRSAARFADEVMKP